MAVPSFVIPLLLQSAVLPVGVAVGVMWGTSRLGGLTRWASLLGVAAGFLASFIAVYRAQWSWVPHQALDWLPWLVLLGLAAGVVMQRSDRTLVRHLMRLLLALGAAALVAWPALASRGLAGVLGVCATAGVLMYVIWTFLGEGVALRPTPAPLLGVVAGGTALALMLDASQLLGQLSGALACVVLTGAAFELLRRRTDLLGPAIGLGVLVLGALLVNAHVFAGFSLAYVLLLCAALLVDPLVAAINKLRQRSGGIGSWAAVAVLAVLPLLLTLGLVLRAAEEAGGY